MVLSSRAAVLMFTALHPGGSLLHEHLRFADGDADRPGCSPFRRITPLWPAPSHDTTHSDVAVTVNLSSGWPPLDVL